MLPQKKLYMAIALAGVLLLGFLTTSVVSYFVAQQSLESRIAEDALPLTSDNIYSEIEQDLLRSVLISSLMAHDTLLRDWTLAGERDPAPIVRYLKEIQHKYDTTTAFFVSDRTHNYYHARGVLKQVSPDDPQDDWYFRARAMNKNYEINVDTDTADPSRLTIFVNYRVSDYSDNLIGVTGIGLSVHSVAKLIASYQQRYGREIFLVDRDGNVKLRGADFKGPAQLRQRPGIRDVATRILANPSASTSYMDPNGRTVYVNSRLIPEFNWYLIVQQSESRVQTRILNTLLINMGVALAITALVCVIGWLSIRNYQTGLEEMASTDTLTGSATRRVFELFFVQVVKTARRNRTPLALLAIDIDQFKPINDVYGHGAGDAALRFLVEVFREHMREADTVCRWGGDEFLILLADCALPDAQHIGENIRAAVAARGVRYGDHQIELTISVGATQRRGGEELPTLIARADEALYASKRNGRDQVTGV